MEKFLATKKKFYLYFRILFFVFRLLLNLIILTDCHEIPVFLNNHIMIIIIFMIIN